MMAAKPIITGATTTALMTPYITAANVRWALGW